MASKNRSGPTGYVCEIITFFLNTFDSELFINFFPGSFWTVFNNEIFSKRK